MPARAEARVGTRIAPALNRPPCSSPSIRTTIEAGSTPAPRSEAATTIWLPRLTLASAASASGGVTSSTQKRNVNAPARAAEGLSKTTS